MSLRDRVNPHIRDLAPYEPGKPIEELERELGIEGSIKLASNENPLGPSPRAAAALERAVGELNRYPDGASFVLRRSLSQRLEVRPEQLVFGCGADEVLELLAKTLLSPGDEVVHAWPSFAMYPIVAKGMGARSIQVPLDGALCHDLPAMAEAIGSRTKLVLLCNPNNPTGTSFGAEAFEEFLAAVPDGVVVAVDEAYMEYARRRDWPDALAACQRRPGTIVLRTFSKIYGLAGLRIGYGVADPELAEYLQRARHPFNVNRLAEVAAVAALEDDEHVARTRALNAEGADYLGRELAALGVETWPTDANFLLARTGPAVYQRLLQEGVIVRPLHGFGLEDCIRVTIGLPEENERFVKALRGIREARA
ncbi:MAG: histidinol-phosphate transaminase [Proteobacteria bacterium]|nr:histidinol-phosphate transaminase [Pseudomonadota bacterium]